MFNKVIMVGNLTRDIDLRYTPNGLAIAKTAIATNRRFKTQSGEQKEETCFIDITIFGRAAEVANQYLSKGRQILIEGRLIYETWVDQTGQKRSKHSIAVDNLQMLGRREESASEMRNRVSQENPKTQTQETKVPEININEDEIPF